jgi:uncharacterized protein YukJ
VALRSEKVLDNYGVLAARAVGSRREGGSDTPHYQVEAVDANGLHFRLAVNVLSQEHPSELLYHVDDDLRHPLTAAVPANLGFTRLPPRPGAANLDFVRGNVCDRDRMRVLPPDVAGPDNDLADLLDHWVGRAVADPKAVVYAFGERWPTEPHKPDKIFGFRPGNGIHDIHMNQGNSGAFTRDDGVWQDGGLLLHFPDQDRWVGIFLAFQGQVWHTDDATGHALGGAGGGGTDHPVGDGSVRLVAALVNPTGPAPEAETVTILNASPAEIDLDGWVLVDRIGQRSPVTGGPIAAGATRVVRVVPPMALGNSGGTISLLDVAGTKVDGVAYTAAQAREGWTVVF